MIFILAENSKEADTIKFHLSHAFKVSTREMRFVNDEFCFRGCEGFIIVECTGWRHGQRFSTPSGNRFYNVVMECLKPARIGLWLKEKDLRPGS